jgi:hypothetical protein
MRRGSSRIYYCILDLPQRVSASHCLHQGVVVTSEATQAISVSLKNNEYSPTQHTMAWSHRKNAGHSSPQKHVRESCMQQDAEEDQKRDGWMTCLRT